VSRSPRHDVFTHCKRTDGYCCVCSSRASHPRDSRYR
jgi:hypothetical protein